MFLTFAYYQKKNPYWDLDELFDLLETKIGLVLKMFCYSTLFN